jgi:hypothetical protein
MIDRHGSNDHLSARNEGQIRLLNGERQWLTPTLASLNCGGISATSTIGGRSRMAAALNSRSTQRSQQGYRSDQSSVEDRVSPNNDGWLSGTDHRHGRRAQPGP